MIYKFEGAPSFDSFDQGDTESADVGLLRASLTTLGEGMVGGMLLRSKRAGVVGGETLSSSCNSTLSVSPLSSGSPSTNGALVSMKNMAVAAPKKHAPNLDKARLMTWIDAMRAQSPPRFRSLHGENPETIDMEAAAYSAWLEKHPSALSTFEKVAKLAKNKQVVVFLDYDGTLSPIVSNPDRAIMTDEVYEFVQLSELYYAGSHGMDIMGPANSASVFKINGTLAKDKMGNDVVFFQPASEFLPLMEKVCNILVETTKSIKGARVENNKFCATVHFRNVKEELWEALASKIQNILKDYPTLSLTHGRKVLEVRPAIVWDKGKAVNYLLNSLGFADSSDVFPVYIGDDRTDEDAFKLLNGMKHSCSILVTSVPKSTTASLSLRDPSEVMEYLRRLVHWKKWGSEKRNSVQNGRYFVN
uniref:Trehalose 6-phosphate phosphatase n=1 Tax=Physcomitrium patens TaxID=3218 RepID=A0A7I4DKB1_PHYPA